MEKLTFMPICLTNFPIIKLSRYVDTCLGKIFGLTSIDLYNTLVITIITKNKHLSSLDSYSG